MNTVISLVCLIAAVSAFPGNGYRYLTPRAIMFGMYGQPNPQSNLIPHGMTGFATGDMIATNTFVGDQFDETEPEQDEVEESETEKAQVGQISQDEAGVTQPPSEDDASALAASSTVKPKSAKPQDDDDEEQGANWPFAPKSGFPAFNTFFPIMIGGQGGRARSGEEGFFPGGATAIANSFSTGKGGVATSHATSFGDPSLESFLKTLNSKNTKATQEE